jgi:hypothetical protein
MRRARSIATIARHACGRAMSTIARATAPWPASAAPAWSPIAISVRGRGEWVIIHRCTGCGELKANRSAGDDSPLLLLRLAVKPLALSPFPLDRLGTL